MFKSPPVPLKQILTRSGPDIENDSKHSGLDSVKLVGYGVDAAILYSDIVTPAHAIGFGIDVVPGVGPVVEKPPSDPRAMLQQLPTTLMQRQQPR